MAALFVLLAGCRRNSGTDTGTIPESLTDETAPVATDTEPANPFPGIITEDGENKAIIYARPDNLKENVSGSMHRVSVNGNPTFVYCSKATISIDGDVNYPEYVYFSFRGTVAITVEALYPVETVEILPSRDEIRFERNGNTVSFSIDRPGQYFVKINGNPANGSTAPVPLYIFANPPEDEETVPSGGIPGEVLYFRAGVYEHHVYQLRSGMTVYLEGGAFVYGQFVSDGVDDIKIIGRGTICAEHAAEGSFGGRAIRLYNGKNIIIEGVQIVDPLHWTIELNNCENVTVRNVKTISSGMGSDSVDVCGCRNVNVEDSFFRASDDVLAVKHSADHVIFRNCVVWADDSNPMTVGYDVADTVKDVLYEKIDVLNYSAPDTTWLEPIMAIEPHRDGDGNGVVDTGSVDGVTYRDIRVDIKLVQQNSLFQFHIYGGKGTIRNVTLEDIWVNYGGYLNGRLMGIAEADPIDGIHFVNVRNSEGYVLTYDDIMRNEYVGSDVLITNDSEDAGGVPADNDRFEYKWDFSNVNGYRNWYYLYLDKASHEIREMYLAEDTTTWLSSEASCFHQYIGIFVGQRTSPVIVWEAPRNGTVSLDASVRMRYRDGGKILLTVMQNESVLYSGAVTPEHPFNDVTELRVSAGDRIWFIMDCDWDPSLDCVRMNAVITYQNS